ncbi:MAG: hypothetical protein ACK4TA_21910 [Saprospiraceae bacterium]
MKKTAYMPRAENEKVTWFNNFSAKLGFYAAKYNISQEELMDVQQSAVFYTTMHHFLNQCDSFLSAAYKYRDMVRDGSNNDAAFQPLTMPMFSLPTPVAPGILKRVRAIINRIKKSIHYSEADGIDLGIEGTETVVDTAAAKPVLKIRISDGGHPEIVWTKQDFDAIEIYKQEADGTWRLVAIDMQPNFVDMEALPPAGTSAVWTYRAIYRKKDKQVGQWSDAVSITVMGM